VDTLDRSDKYPTAAKCITGTTGYHSSMNLSIHVEMDQSTGVAIWKVGVEPRHPRHRSRSRGRSSSADAIIPATAMDEKRELVRPRAGGTRPHGRRAPIDVRPRNDFVEEVGATQPVVEKVHVST
jgi:hypothetical protein